MGKKGRAKVARIDIGPQVLRPEVGIYFNPAMLQHFWLRISVTNLAAAGVAGSPACSTQELGGCLPVPLCVSLYQGCQPAQAPPIDKWPFPPCCMTLSVSKGTIGPRV